MIIKSIHNQIFLMEYSESIVIFIIDGRREVDINMASINMKNVSLGN